MDFPTDAAVVFAFFGNATEVFVIFGIYREHFRKPPVVYMGIITQNHRFAMHI